MTIDNLYIKCKIHCSSLIPDKGEMKKADNFDTLSASEKLAIEQLETIASFTTNFVKLAEKLSVSEES